jgi:hypothetical protein
MQRLILLLGLPLVLLDLKAQIFEKKFLYRNPDVAAHQILRVNTASALDSTITYDFNSSGDSILQKKYEFFYDVYGNLSLWASYVWDSANVEWEGERKYKYTYNANGFQIEFARFTWNGEVWEANERYTEVIDEFGRVLVHSKYSWEWAEGRDIWYESLRRENTFDANGKLILTMIHTWDPLLEGLNYGEKIEYGYDDTGHRIMQVNYKYDREAGLWIPDHRRFNTHDSSFSHLTTTESMWHPEAGDWSDVFKTETIINQENRPIMESQLYFDIQSGDTINGGKVENVYDYDTLLLSSLEYYWDKDSADWINKNLHEFSYNSFGQQVSWVHYYWRAELNEWDHGEFGTSTYDGNGNPTLNCTLSWREEGPPYDTISKSIFGWDDSGNQTLQESYHMDEGLNALTGSMKIEIEYNAEGMRTGVAYYSWDTAYSDWIGSHKHVNDWDANGNRILNIIYQWDTVNWDWINGGQGEYYIDANRDTTVYIYQEWDVIQQNMVLKSKTYYYYSESDLGATQDEMQNLKIYPNPFTEILNIVLPSSVKSLNFELYDLSGRRVSAEFRILDNRIILNRRGLAQGIYFYRIQAGKVYSGKIIAR